MNVRAYQRAEQGDLLPRLTTLLRLAKVFGVPPYELLKVEDVDPDAVRVGRGGRRVKGLPASRAQPPGLKPRRRVTRSAS